MKKIEIQKTKTRNELIEERRNAGESIPGILLSMFFGDLKNAPMYNNPDEIARRAHNDFRRSDFSEAGDYLASLVAICDTYENYLRYAYEVLQEEGYVVDEYGVPEKLELKKKTND